MKKRKIDQWHVSISDSGIIGITGNKEDNHGYMLNGDYRLFTNAGMNNTRVLGYLSSMAKNRPW